MFVQQFDHSFNDIFNQYVNMESSSADGNKDVSFPSGDFEQLFPLDSLSSECGALSSPTISPSNKRSRQSPQPWSTPTQDLWSQPQETGAASSSSVDQGTFSFHDTVQPSAVSNLSLNLDAQSSSSSSRPAVAHGLTSTPLSTPPETPRKKVCMGSGITTPKSIRHHQDTGDRRRLLRKQSSSPSLTRSSRAQKNRMAYSEASAPRFHKFSLHSSDDRLPLSPPPTDLLAQHENLSATHLNGSTDQFSGDSAEMPQQYDSSIFNQSPAISMPSPSAGALARQQQRYMSQPNSTTLTSSPPSADEIFSSPHSSGSQSLSSWYSDSLAPSAFSFTPDLNHDAQQWWSPMASRLTPQQQSSYQPMLEAPIPQRPIPNHDQHNDMLQGGLMIQFNPSFDMSAPAEPSFPSSTMSSSAPAAAQESQTYHPVSSTHINPSFTSTPQIQHHNRSPSLSPRNKGTATSLKSDSTTAATTTTTTPRTGTAMKTPHRRSYERKMSAPSNTPKPVKTHSPRGSNKSVSVSFVNFTPSDSKKILTGVAPSGSSKTKARREQEARDRRRKLGEAALKAVRNAGGDIDALEAVLC